MRRLPLLLLLPMLIMLAPGAAHADPPPAAPAVVAPPASTEVSARAVYDVPTTDATPTPTPVPTTPLPPTPTPTPVLIPTNETVELAFTLTKNPFQRKTFAPYFAGQITDDGVALSRPWCRNLSGAVAISRKLGSRRVSLGAPLSLEIRHRAGACQATFGTKSNRLPSGWRGRSYEFTVRIKAKKRLSWNGGTPTKPATLTKRYTLRVG